MDIYFVESLKQYQELKKLRKEHNPRIKVETLKYTDIKEPVSDNDQIEDMTPHI